MKRFYLLIALLLALPFAESCAQPKEIRTVAILGDSYSTFDGYIPEGNACWYFTTPQGDNDVVSVEQTWWHQFCEEGGYELLMNESYSGSTICHTGYDGADYSDRSFCYRMNLLVTGDEIADLILVFGGTNDYGNGQAPLGTVDDTSIFTFYGAVRTLCVELIKRYPSAAIVFITPLHRWNENGGLGTWKPDGVVQHPLCDYVKAIKEVCELANTLIRP